MMMRTVWVAMIASVLALSQTQAADIRLLASWDKTNPAIDLLVVPFAKDVEEGSKGALKVQSSGPETVPPFEQLQPVQTGIFPLLFTHGVYHYGTTGIGVVFDAIGGTPASRRESGLIDLVDSQYQKLGVKVVAMAVSRDRAYNIILREPVSAQGDLAGRKIRGTPSYFSVIKMLGASTVTLPGNEIYTGLEKGVIDGAGWPALGVLGPRYYEVAKYLMRPTFGVAHQIMLMNKAAFDRLSTVEREAVSAAGRKMEETWFTRYDALVEAEEKAMLEKGVRLTELASKHKEQIEVAWAEGVWALAIQKSPKEAEELRQLAKSKGLTK